MHYLITFAPVACKAGIQRLVGAKLRDDGSEDVVDLVVQLEAPHDVLEERLDLGGVEELAVSFMNRGS